MTYIRSRMASSIISISISVSAQVTGLLKEFTRNCGEQLVQELQTQKRRGCNVFGPKALGDWGEQG